MKKIGILGASSQVGSSVALFLKDIPGIHVTCFIRSSYSAIFFELFGIEHQLLHKDKDDRFREQIGAMDVILDFGYPTGQIHEILQRGKDTVRVVMGCMKKGSAYFYMSSIMAYGMPENGKWIRHYRLPRTSYAYIKRSIETFTSREGRRQGIRVYNFRLSQVHGFLQSVNGSFRKKLTESPIAMIDGKPDDPVNIIFIHPLCEAIVQCAEGVYPPGLYTLVANPQWTLKQLYQYYLDYYGLPAQLSFLPAETPRRRSLFQTAIDWFRPYRSLIETFVLMRLPGLAVKVKGRFRKAEMVGSLGSALKDIPYIDYNLLGTPPLRMLSGPSAGLEQVFPMEKKTEEQYNAALAVRRQ